MANAWFSHANLIRIGVHSFLGINYNRVSAILNNRYTAFHSYIYCILILLPSQISLFIPISFHFAFKLSFFLILSNSILNSAYILAIYQASRTHSVFNQMAIISNKVGILAFLFLSFSQVFSHESSSENGDELALDPEDVHKTFGSDQRADHLPITKDQWTALTAELYTKFQCSPIAPVWFYSLFN